VQSRSNPGREVSIFQRNDKKIDVMKQGSNQRRSRGRGNNNNNGGGRRNPRTQSYESNGPDVKVRGTAQQVLDKYLQLARDAQSGGDRVKAEAYLQFAEHYYRIVNVDQDDPQDKRVDRGDRNDRNDRNDRGDRNEVQKPEAAMSEQASGESVTTEASSERPENAERPARGRGRPRGGNGRAEPKKNEATLAAEAAAANEAAMKAAKAEKAAAPKPVRIAKAAKAEGGAETDDQAETTEIATA